VIELKRHTIEELELDDMALTENREKLIRRADMLFDSLCREWPKLPIVAVFVNWQAELQLSALSSDFKRS